ncbi:unknown protein [Simkania negevensis Z]|uniref:Uncharacterized protein n=1 Tax=Simkania negevensis (strain ATCC VR-1471 / DSM 27360 / Z) TaxID=331113 RepID=F8L3U3_SIMNZ|nr:unknown protein [Simkania negevensis Z]
MDICLPHIKIFFIKDFNIFNLFFLYSKKTRWCRQITALWRSRKSNF